MVDNSTIAHELALIAVRHSVDTDFAFMSNGSDTEECREVFASSLLEEYNYFYKKIFNSLK